MARWGIPALVAVAVFAFFCPVFDAGFVGWDDDVNFTGNYNYRGFSPGNLRWMFTDISGHYIPLTWLTLAADYELWGMDPAGYHFTSLLLHAANAVLFYFILLALLRRIDEASPPGPPPRGPSSSPSTPCAGSPGRRCWRSSLTSP